MNLYRIFFYNNLFSRISFEAKKLSDTQSMECIHKIGTYIVYLEKYDRKCKNIKSHSSLFRRLYL